MRMTWLARLGVAAAAVLALAALLDAAFSAREEVPEPPLLAGRLLMASPQMSDPRFFHAVILLVRHDRNGALGIMINRPLEDRPLASLLGTPGEGDVAVGGSVRIFIGGPVQPDIGFVLHSLDYHRTGTIEVDGYAALTSNPQVLRDLATGRGPRKSLVAFGYAGWAAGQLEAELDLGAWFTAIGDEKLIFDEPRDSLWDAAMQRRVPDL